MTKLHMAVNDLDSQTKKLIQQSEDMQKDASDMTFYLNNLYMLWQGEDADQFRGELKTLVDSVQQAIAPLEQLGHRVMHEIDEWTNNDLQPRFNNGLSLDPSSKLRKGVENKPWEGFTTAGPTFGASLGLKGWLRSATWLPWWLRYPGDPKTDYQYNSLPLFGNWVKHEVTGPNLDLSLDASTSGGKTSLGPNVDYTAYKESWKSVLTGDKNLGITTGLIFTAGSAGAGVGGQLDSDGHLKAGADVDGSVAGVDIKGGLNILGWNVGFDIGLNLGGGVGLEWDEGPKFKWSLFKVGLDLGKAWDSTTPS